jgi:hypothetical protein
MNLRLKSKEIKPWVTIKKAHIDYGTPATTLRDWISKGIILAHKVLITGLGGSIWAINRQSLEDYLDKNQPVKREDIDV